MIGGKSFIATEIDDAADRGIRVPKVVRTHFLWKNPLSGGKNPHQTGKHTPQLLIPKSFRRHYFEDSGLSRKYIFPVNLSIYFYLFVKVVKNKNEHFHLHVNNVFYTCKTFYFIIFTKFKIKFIYEKIL